ncbi:MAG: hypothetical protein ASARMPREDX12_003411 [Alectoria sarmentosa]|nr:MAG: hypothetical protein ASARMPREDX12_003411 [Alectoria sarmentosa]
MAVFSELPNEIICVILPLVEPEDLENFAQAARRIQELARPLLQVHRKMIRKYCILTEGLVKGEISPLLKVALTNSHLGRYVKEIKICCIDCRYSRSDWYTEDDIASVQVVAAESKYLVPDGNIEDLCRLSLDITHRRGGIPLALLLPLLPNLEALMIEDLIGKPTPSWPETVIMNASIAAKPVLTKLRKVQLRSHHGAGPNLRHLLRFAALPSLRELSAFDTYGPQRTPCKCQYTFVPASEVTKLELCDSTVDSETLCSFLQNFGKLQTFTFSTYNGVIYLILNPSLIRDALLSLAKTTLQTLTILGHPKKLSFMGSLREFEVLAELHTHRALLLPTTQAQLSAVLPKSLRRLSLIDEKVRDAVTYQTTLRDTLSSKLAGSLLLQHVSFETPDFDGLSDDHFILQRDCNEKGLSLTFSRWNDVNTEGEPKGLLRGMFNPM